MSKKIKLSGSGGVVTLDITPQISEQGSTIINDIGDIRAPASILIWMGSPARTFSINGKFLSRTPEEAQQSFDNKHLLASWRMPEEGGGVNSSYPSIVQLSGYGEMFKKIPTLITSVSFEWPDDIDYVVSTNGTPMPILMSFSLSLKEAQAVQQVGFNKFNIQEFRQGRLDGW